MDTRVKPGDPANPTRRTVLRQCLMMLAHTLQDGARNYRFAGSVKPFPTFDDREFDGLVLDFGTDIEKALRVARKHSPARINLITDGAPTQTTPEEVIATAQTIFARIDTYFCGSHTNERATRLCRKLAQYGGNALSTFPARTCSTV